MENLFEHSLVIIKPDGVKRGITGDVIARFEKAGLKLVACKMVHPTKEQIMKHLPCTVEWRTAMGNKSLEDYEKYGKDPIQEIGTSDPHEIGTKIQGWIVEYLTQGPVVVLCFYGLHAIEMIRKLIGHTIPAKAQPGTVRGDYSTVSALYANNMRVPIYNLIHASGDISEATNEINVWFNKEEIVKFE